MEYATGITSGVIWVRVHTTELLCVVSVLMNLSICSRRLLYMYSQLQPSSNRFLSFFLHNSTALYIHGNAVTQSGSWGPSPVLPFTAGSIINGPAG